MSEPKIGLVTVLYNGIEVLQGFFESLGNQSYKNYILYVIDNSPNDDAFDEAKRLSDKFSINSVFVNNHDNFGVAKGNNQGIVKSLENGCDYVLLLNNDIEFSENTIKDMVVYAEENSETIIVPKIYYHGSNKIWMAGGHISKIRAITPHRGNGEEDKGQYNHIEYVNYAPTCFMLINKDVFNKVGVMDEIYFVYYDDSDFVWRANNLGFKILYYPKAIVTHKVSFSTGGDESLFTIYYTNRNRVLFIRKNFTFFIKIMSTSFFLLALIIKYIKYNNLQRERLSAGILSGLSRN